MQSYRIVAIAQVRNELRRGNLERFFRYLKPLVDQIVIYDDASTDGSYEYAVQHADRVLRGVKSSFYHETQIKKQVLAAAQKLNPDFILWLDTDEVLTKGGRGVVNALCDECVAQNADGVSLHELNLWRSACWVRLDEMYNDGWYVRLWRNTPKLQYPKTPEGLHKIHFPQSINKIIRSNDAEVIHYGFSTDEGILFKYLNYRRYGQSGWALNRFIDESELHLERVPNKLFPDGLQSDDSQPVARPIPEWHRLIDKKLKELLRPSISIISMIYKSTAWLKFCYEQVLRYTDLSDKEFFFIANDPTREVLEYLEQHYIPHVIFRTTDEQKKVWYINNVYRAYNYGAQVAQGDYLLYINSDMAFTPDWVENMFRYLTGNNCVSARLVESGKMRSGEHGISKNFGREISQYDEKSFHAFAKSVAEDQAIKGGLYMPLLIRRKDFLNVGGYPEGNVVANSDFFHPTIATKDDPLISGDKVLIEKLATKGVSHNTSYASVVYHFQEGEKDDPQKPLNEKSDARVVILNDYLTGSMGERTMWNVLVEKLPNAVGVDKNVVGGAGNFKYLARGYIRQNFPNVRVIIQNATFIDVIDPEIHTVAFLQDDLRKMNRPSKQQESNLLLAKTRVANSSFTASSYSEFNFEIIPLGVDDRLFQPIDRQSIRKELALDYEKIGIFVGEHSDVKGWSEIKNIIQTRQDIHWLVVSKYDQTFSAPNATLFNRIPQTQLVKLLNASDFFILGSPVETQCLAAIEACLCDVPVIMHLTGIFSDFSESERGRVGFFSENLSDQIDEVYSKKSKLSPRSVILERGLGLDTMVNKWKELLVAILPVIEQGYLLKKEVPKKRLFFFKSKRAISEVSLAVLRIFKKILKAILPQRTVKFLYKIVYRPKEF